MLVFVLALVSVLLFVLVLVFGRGYTSPFCGGCLVSAGMGGLVRIVEAGSWGCECVLPATEDGSFPALLEIEPDLVEWATWMFIICESEAFACEETCFLPCCAESCERVFLRLLLLFCLTSLL